MTPLDTRNRRLHDLRISVTDRCNFRCRYCMPREVFGKDYEFLPRDQLLSFEEITRVAEVSTRLGVRKIRLTGGEPLLRKGVEDLIARLAGIEAVEDLTMTTNGSVLERRAAALAEAGLDRITVSLDSLNDETFMAMNDSGVPVAVVLEGIEAAAAAGFTPIKINVVVKKGVNDHEVVDLARHFKGTGHIVRFIEYMDVGHTNGWRLDDVMPAAAIVNAIHAEMPLQPVKANYSGEVANRWRYDDGEGEIGVISSVTAPFCGACTRARISAEGMLYTCLFATGGHDLRALLRDGATDDDLAAFLSGVWDARDDRYSELRSSRTTGLPKIEMSYIGG